MNKVKTLKSLESGSKRKKSAGWGPSFSPAPAKRSLRPFSYKNEPLSVRKYRKQEKKQAKKKPTDLKVRLGILIGVCLALAITVVVRLWYLQILANKSFEERATLNQVRISRSEAPRGRILSSDGQVLVDNRVSLSVGVETASLKDPKTRADVFGRLSTLLGISVADIEKRLKSPKVSPYMAIPIADDVPLNVMSIIKERQDEFPGVVPVMRPVRIYPQQRQCLMPDEVTDCPPLAPHVLGYVGETTESDLKVNPDYKLGDTIGRGGIEAMYEPDLRGKAGTKRLEVNSHNRFLRVLDETPPIQGNDIVLTLDSKIQRYVQDGLEKGLLAARARWDKNTSMPYIAPAGSVVVMDPRNGAILAMASYPHFNPAQFVGGIPAGRWKALNDPANYFPLNNRTIQGQYAPGSTFKVVTATAALANGFISPNDNVGTPGSFSLGSRSWSDWKPGGHGSADLYKSLVQSVDVYYYKLGYEMYQAKDRGGDYLQNTARQMGLGKPTQVDLPHEKPGRIPDEAWKTQVNDTNPKIFPDGKWYPGDAVNISIGQGDILVTPLQMAMVYASYANGGTIYRPHVLGQVRKQDGKALSEYAVGDLGHIPDQPNHIADIASALVDVPRSGTAAGAFAGFPLAEYPVAGKTGTAEVQGKQDTAWFVSWAPADNPQYVVAASVEQGGHGASAAGPIARYVYEQIFGVQTAGISQGSEVD